MRTPIRKITSLAVLSLMSTHTAHAGGFSLYTESSAAAIGNYAAGIAAEGGDASIGWYNPAGLVLIKKQEALLGGVGVFPNIELSGTSTYTSPGLPLYRQTFSGLQGAESAGVPSFHYALPLNDRVTVGLSIVSPFGLSTNYGTTSPVRYEGTFTKLQTIDLSPELGGKITDHVSLGLGLDLQYATVNLNSVIGAPPAMNFYLLQDPSLPLTPSTLDSTSNNSGDSFAVGFHAGALLRFNDEHTRIGLNYQSETRHQFTGTSQLTGRLADPTLFLDEAWLANPNARFSTNALYSDYVNLPAIVTLSAYQDVNQQLAVLGSVVYSGFDTFNAITLHNVAVGTIDIETFNSIQTTKDVTLNENYQDAWRVSAGANYRINSDWMLRVGGGYDQTPTVNAQRDVRLPDSNRWALSVGAHYQMRPSIGFDLGYTHLFAANTALLNSTLDLASSTYNVNASAQNSADLVGLQGVWTIDKGKN